MQQSLNQLLNVLQQGANPQAMLSQQMQMLQKNPDPRAQQVYKMIAGKSPQEIEQLARNLYASSGKDYSAFEAQTKQNLGIR